LGKYEKAIEYHTKSLQFRQTILGEQHSATLQAQKNLEIVLRLKNQSPAMKSNNLTKTIFSWNVIPVKA